MKLATIGAVVAAMVMFGCGDGGDTADDGASTGSSANAGEASCSLDATLSGAETATLDFSGLGHCGSARGGEGSPVTLLFGYGSTLNETGLGVTVRVPMKSPTETGDVAVEVVLGRGCNLFGGDCASTWASAESTCSMSIERHEFVNEDDLFANYLVAGPIACAAPLVAADASEVTATGLAIATTHIWDKR